MLIANVKLKWKKSASTDVVKQKLRLTTDGTLAEIELSPGTEEHVFQAKASTAFAFMIESIDSEGKSAMSMVYSTTLGDLTDPLPASELGHEILSIDEVPDLEVTPEVAPEVTPETLTPETETTPETTPVVETPPA